MKEVITLAFDRLDALFRYVLPGVVVLGLTYAAHPSWFSWYHPSQGHDAVLLMVVTVSSGAVVYCLHRFSVHQVLDVLCWCCLNKLAKSYRDDLMAAVVRGTGATGIDRHIAVRSSQLILLFIFAEAALIFSVTPPEPGSVIHDHRSAVLIGALVALLVAIVQYSLVNDLDRRAERPTRKRSTCEATESSVQP